MATDIAFALGVLSLLSGRVPFSVKVFLLAIAIADDIGAIVVIAVFYTSQLDPEALAAAAVLLALIVAMDRAGARSVDLHMVVGVCFWLAVLQSGVHATLAGVALGLLTPASPFYARAGFTGAAEELLRRFRAASENAEEQQGTLSQIEELAHGSEAELDRLERQLHPWVSYLVVPVFALANAGVSVSGDVLSAAASSPVTLGVALGLLIGKPAGIIGFTWLAVRLRLCELPTGASWAHIAGIGLLGGIGFTVSLLINGLAFTDAALIDEAKIGVLVASVIAGIAGFVFLRIVHLRQRNGNGN
jgi:NhaA family Na+:H+ antiporter